MKAIIKTFEIVLVFYTVRFQINPIDIGEMIVQNLTSYYRIIIYILNLNKSIDYLYINIEHIIINENTQKYQKFITKPETYVFAPFTKRCVTEIEVQFLHWDCNVRGKALADIIRIRFSCVSFIIITHFSSYSC